MPDIEDDTTLAGTAAAQPGPTPVADTRIRCGCRLILDARSATIWSAREGLALRLASTPKRALGLTSSFRQGDRAADRCPTIALSTRRLSVIGRLPAGDDAGTLARVVDLDLRNRVAVVTGASRGIGLAIVEQLVAEGVRVVAGARHTDGLDGSGVVAVDVDLSTSRGPATLVERALGEYGAIDFLVNNVGGGRLHADGFASITDQDWEWHFQTNFMSAIRATRAALPTLIERHGVIVNISSINAHRPGGSIPEYSALKAALNNVTKQLAIELAPHDVRVLTVSPGPIITDLQMGPDGVAGFLGRSYDEHLAAADWVPLQRYGTAAEIAATVAFLLSDQSSYTTGSEVLIDGGFTAS